MMKSYQYAEEYLEVISGLRDPISLAVQSHWFSPIINLARYDISFLKNVSEKVLGKQSLTELQAALLLRLLEKYQRQLRDLGIDVLPIIESPKYRSPFRVVDKKKILDWNSGKISLVFPFETMLIDQVREFAEDSQGNCSWDNKKKSWTLSTTDYNIVWSYEWSKKHGFSITDEMEKLYLSVIDESKKNYSLQLIRTSQGYTVSNATKSLTQWIDRFDNDLLKLVDHSSILGYGISDELLTTLTTKYGKNIIRLLTSKNLRLNPIGDIGDSDIADLIEYSTLTNRWPMIVYEPDLTNRALTMLSKYVPDKDIMIVGTRNKENSVVDLTHKIVHTLKPIKFVGGKVPLLVSGASMMFGGSKQFMLQQAEKVVYLSSDIYNKKNGTL